MTYQLVDIDLEVGGKLIRVEAGMAPNLPAPVLLGTDVAKLTELLLFGEDWQTDGTALLVTTRAQKMREEREAAIQATRELRAAATPSPVGETGEDLEEEAEPDLEEEPEPKVQEEPEPELEEKGEPPPGARGGQET